MIILLIICSILLSDCSYKSKENSLEIAIIKTIKAFQNKDEGALNNLILKKNGIIILHQPTMFYQIFISDKIKPAPSYECFFQSLQIDNYKILFEKLPEFSCNNECWNKPSGIYCDTINIDKTLSTAAKESPSGYNWSSEDIKKFDEIENKSVKIVVIGNQDKDGYAGGEFFIFHLTLFDNKWHLTIVEFPDYCSA